MLVEFTVENFLSFKDKITFSMVADSSISKEHLNNIFSEPVYKKFDLLKTSVVYGANASGKSNLLKAIDFMKNKIFSSFRDSLIDIDKKEDVSNFKLSTTTLNKPSKFEVIFIQNKKRYRYGFEIDNNKVHSEWLYHVPEKRETILFTRKGNKFDIKDSFKEGRGWEDKTRDNVLFLSLLAQFNGEKSKEVLDWFKKLLYIHAGRFDINFSLEKARTNPEFKKKLLELIQILDIGIENIEITEISLEEEVKNLPKDIPNKLKEAFKSLNPNAKSLYASTIRNQYDELNNIVSQTSFDINNMESDGTKKIIALFAYWFDVFEKNKILIIDELDSSLHSLLTIEMIKLFHSNLSNPNNAQLIFSLHDTSLLSNDFFRRDQIWFIEKNPHGVSDLYSFVEYRLANDTKVRNDASYGKNYLKGKYGAIPFLGNLERLFEI
ncbi:MAG: ATP-binding protein [Cyanobacteriota bacterium]